MNIIDDLEDFKELFYPEPQKNVDNHEYKKTVFARTAVDDIISIAKSNPCDILTSLTEYRNRLYVSYYDINTSNETAEVLFTFIDVFRQIKNWLLHRDIDELF